MPDNERDQIIERVAHVLIDVSTEDVTADAYDMARALDHAGLLRTGGDTCEVAKLRAERDHWKTLRRETRAELMQVKQVLREVDAKRDRAAAETAALRERIEELTDELWDLASDGDVLDMVSKFRHALDGGQP